MTTADTQPSKNFTIIDQYIKDLSVENFLTPQQMIDKDINPNGEIALGITSEKITDTVHQVHLNVTVTAKDTPTKDTNNAKTLYIIEVDYMGLAHIEGFDEEVPILIGVEVPRIIFPFVRHIIASVTTQAGFPTLMLKPIDFLSLFMEQQTAETEQHSIQ